MACFFKFNIFTFYLWLFSSWTFPQSRFPGLHISQIRYISKNVFYRIKNIGEVRISVLYWIKLLGRNSCSFSTGNEYKVKGFSVLLLTSKDTRLKFRDSLWSASWPNNAWDRLAILNATQRKATEWRVHLINFRSHAEMTIPLLTIRLVINFWNKS